jgi:hypothetical protein
MRWYEEDKGVTALQEIVVMMEMAGRGETFCPKG